jgi:hypothetical protein
MISGGHQYLCGMFVRGAALWPRQQPHVLAVEMGPSCDHVQRLGVVASGYARGVVVAVTLATLKVRPVHTGAAQRHLIGSQQTAHMGKRST